MNIKIDKLEDTTFSIGQIVDLLHESFQERLDAGLNLQGAFIKVDDVEKLSKSGAIFVAYGDEFGKDALFGVGITTIHKYVDGKFAYNDYAAISPSAKRMGIGSEMLQYRISFAKEMNCDFLISTTAVNATSSVKYHLKNGFKKWKYVSFYGRSYYSYVFRMPLCARSKWDNPLIRLLTLGLSFIVTRCTFKKGGSLTLLGKLLWKIPPFRKIGCWLQC